MKRLMLSLLVLTAAFGSYWVAGFETKKTVFLPDSDKKQTLAQLEKKMGETELMLASVFRSPQDYPLGWADSLKQLQSNQRQTYVRSRQFVVEQYEGRRAPGWARLVRNNLLYLTLAVLSLLALIWMPGRKEKGAVLAPGSNRGKNNGGWRQPIVKKSGIPVDPAGLEEFQKPSQTEDSSETLASERSGLEKSSFEDRFKHSLKDLSEIAKNTLEEKEKNPEHPENPDEEVSVSHFEVIQKPSGLEPKAILDEEDEIINPVSELSEEDPEKIQKPEKSVAGNPQIEEKGKTGELNKGQKSEDTAVGKDGWENEEKKAKWKRFEDEENRKVIVMKLVRRGSTVTEISQRLKISKTEVELMIKDFKSRL